MHDLRKGLWFLLLGLSALQVPAQTYPTRPVKIIIPYAAGGGADAAARLLASGLGRELGQSFIVESRPGANTAIAAAAVAKSPADGYTLLLTGSATMSINPLVVDKLPYDPVADFSPISMVSHSPFMVVANSELGVNTLEDLLRRAREKPGAIAYVSNGVGGAIHLGVELLAQRAKVEFNHVPYKGFAPAMPDLLSGRTPVAMMDMAPLGPHLKSGKIKVLAVTSPQRYKLFPDAPTVAELGFPGYQVESWFSIYAPAKTPPVIIALLGEKIRRWAASLEAIEGMAAIGQEPEGSTAEYVLERFLREQKSFGPLVKAANIRAD